MLSYPISLLYWRYSLRGVGRPPIMGDYSVSLKSVCLVSVVIREMGYRSIQSGLGAVSLKSSSSSSYQCLCFLHEQAVQWDSIIVQRKSICMSLYVTLCINTNDLSYSSHDYFLFASLHCSYQIFSWASCLRFHSSITQLSCVFVE